MKGGARRDQLRSPNIKEKHRDLMETGEDEDLTILMIVPRSHASTLNSIVYWIVQKNLTKKISIDDLQMSNKDVIKSYCSHKNFKIGSLSNKKLLVFSNKISLSFTKCAI